MPTPRILAFSGSTRENSYNTRLVKAAAEGARAAGAEVTLINLRDFPMPLFDEDAETRDGMNANARKLKDLFIAHHGFLISSPEYNSSYPAVLKNAIDWVSRTGKKPDGTPEAPHAGTTNKVVALLAASPGALGGIRMLPELRRVLANINCLVIPEQFSLAKAHEAFDDAGRLKDPKQAAMAMDVAKKLVHVCAKLNG